MGRKNEIKCPHCNSPIRIPGAPKPPVLKEATIKEIARIGDPELEALLSFDREYGPSDFVEGFIWTVARSINKYGIRKAQEANNERRNTKQDNVRFSTDLGHHITVRPSNGKCPGGIRQPA